MPALPKGTTGVLVDRCLSYKIAPVLTRFSGLQGVALKDVFTNDPRTQDVQFLGACGEAGWVVFTQNDEMWKNTLEMGVIRSEGTRVFTLTNSHLGLDGTGMLFGRHLLTIRRRLGRPGPCFWKIYEERIDKKIQ